MRALQRKLWNVMEGQERKLKWERHSRLGLSTGVLLPKLTYTFNQCQSKFKWLLLWDMTSGP